MFLYSEEYDCHWYIMPWEKFFNGNYDSEWYGTIYNLIVDKYGVYPYEVQEPPEGSEELSLYGELSSHG